MKVLFAGKQDINKKIFSPGKKRFARFREMQGCFLCLGPATEECRRCDASLCVLHTSAHILPGGACSPVRVQYDCEIGRYLVATRPVQAGELLISELPLVIGPYTRSKAQCLGCCRLISPTTSPSKAFTCPSCHFPLCGPACQQSRWHRDECQLFKEADWQADVSRFDQYDSQYCAVATLRMLLVMEKEEAMFVEGQQQKKVEKKVEKQVQKQVEKQVEK